MIRDYAKMALMNLLHRKTRSWLTLIGIFIGITAVVALISLGQGLQHAITAEFLELGADKIQISAKGNEFTGNQALTSALKDRDLRTVERTNGVILATTYNMRSAKIEWRDQIAFYGVMGFSTEERRFQLMNDYWTLKLEEGRSLKQGDMYKAVIGKDLSNPDKLESPLKVGDKVKINSTTFEIVGMYAKMGDPGADTAIYVSEDAFKILFDTQGTYDGIVAQVNPGEDAEAVADEVQAELRRERGLDEGDENFNVQTPKDLIDSFLVVFNIVNFVIIGIAMISLIVGAVGIMNTMYTAVLERTKEIGIMKAIGATNKAVLTIFLIESGMLGLIGGLIGLITGLGLAKITEYIGKTVLDTLLLSAWWSWGLVFGALAFAFITGAGAGIMPAYRASKQKPVDSLRYE
jgi:putative ABC transport system permease protein